VSHTIDIAYTLVSFSGVVKGVARLTNHFLVKESLRNHLAVLQECAPTREIIGLGDKISDSNAATAIR
jgi:hypothetical protein